MLIEQIIEFEFREDLPSYDIPTSRYFSDKAKISKANFRVDNNLQLKYCISQCTFLPPTWAKLLTKFNPKMKDYKRALN